MRCCWLLTFRILLHQVGPKLFDPRRKEAHEDYHQTDDIKTVVGTFSDQRVSTDIEAQATVNERIGCDILIVEELLIPGLVGSNPLSIQSHSPVPIRLALYNNKHLLL